MDEEQRRIEVVVPDDQLSLAIGRRGQNVRLASQLTGWDIDILTEAEESERRTEEFRTRSQMFIDALDIDDVIAHLLVTEGFTSVEEVAFVPLEELAGIEGFDEDIAGELQERGRVFIERQNEELEARRNELGVSDELAAIEGMTPAMLVALGEKGVKTLDDLGDLAGDELVEIVQDSAKLTLDEANAIIMAARAHWFEEADAASAPLRSRSHDRVGQRSFATGAESGGTDVPRRTTMRRGRCAVASSPGRSAPKAELLRFVVGPDGTVVPDIASRLPGRGLWLTARRDIVATAIGKRLFGRAARAR